MAMDFTITATHLTIPRVLTPLNDSFVFSDEPDERRFSLRRKLDTRLILVQADFDWLLTIENGANRCQPITVSFVRGSYVWSGKFNMSNLEFDLDACQVEVEVLPNDAEDCLRNVLDAEINLLTISPQNVSLYGGSIQFATYAFTNEAIQSDALGNPIGVAIPATSDPTDPSWRFLSISATSTTGGGTWTGTITWVRQFTTRACVGGVGGTVPTLELPGWILRQNNCATAGNASFSKPLPIFFDVTPLVFNTTTWTKTNSFPGANLANNRISNVRSILPTIRTAVEACGLTFRSNFFNLNASGASPSNDVYTNQAPLYRNLAVIQKSDLRFPNALSPATRGITTIGKLLDDIATMLRVFWFIDTNGDFRLEHESWRSTTNGYNLTNNAAWIEAPARKYQRLEDDYPRFQRFEFSEDFNDIDFEGLDIVYSSACAYDVENFSTEVLTNIAPILIDRNVTNDSGFAMVAFQIIQSTLRIGTVPCPLSSNEKLNGIMSWAYLHSALHFHERPFSAMNVNGSNTSAITVRPRKRQRLTAGVCPGDYETINTLQRINTPLGWGRAERLTYDYKTQILEAEILIP